MSVEMYNYITDNIHMLNYDLDNGLVITPKNTNGSICSSTGYLRVKVKGKTLQVHQILSVLYFGDNCIGMQINHIDGNKLNNKKENLETVSQLENLKHQRDNDLYAVVNCKEIDKFDLNDNYICTYGSIAEASRDIGLNSSCAIIKALNMLKKDGGRRTAKGFYWSYRNTVT